MAESQGYGSVLFDQFPSPLANAATIGQQPAGSCPVASHRGFQALRTERTLHRFQNSEPILPVRAMQQADVAAAGHQHLRFARGLAEPAHLICGMTEALFGFIIMRAAELEERHAALAVIVRAGFRADTFCGVMSDIQELK